MGQPWSSRRHAAPSIAVPDLASCVPPIDRDASTLAEKEAALEMQFFVETCRLKELAAGGNVLAELLRREDNSLAGPLCYEPLPLPVDDEGFVRSFPAQDAEGIRDFFSRYGLVVVEGVISDEACHRSVDEVWAHAERQVSGLVREDPSTWDKWPGLAKLGILGNSFLLSRQLCENRQEAAVHGAFAAVFGTERLVVNIGRASMMRPTRGVKDGVEVGEKPEWRTVEGAEWLHWDVNPFTGAASTFSWRAEDLAANRGYDRLRVQAILALSDCGPCDGGFFCVPGSHRVLRSWAHARGPDVDDSAIVNPESAVQLRLPDGDPLKAHGQKVPVRRGSLLIWDAHLAHCNFPNDSSRPRIVQYVQMARADDPVMRPLCTSEAYLPPPGDFTLTELGRKLYGLAPWS